jgi:hypothetical protein
MITLSPRRIIVPRSTEADGSLTFSASFKTRLTC